MNYFEGIKEEFRKCDLGLSAFLSKNAQEEQDTENSEIPNEEGQIYNNLFSKVCESCARICLHTDVFSLAGNEIEEVKQWIGDWSLFVGDQSNNLRFLIGKHSADFFDSLLEIRGRANKGFPVNPAVQYLKAEFFEIDNMEYFGSPHIQFLAYCIFSIEFDLNLQIEDDLLKRSVSAINALEGSLKDIGIEEQLVDQLTKKFKFLSFKILQRKKRDEIRLYNNSSPIYESRKIHDLLVAGLEPLYKKIDYHYLGKGDPERSIFSNAKAERDSRTIRTRQQSYHSLIKHFKDELPNCSRVQELVAEFEDSLKNAHQVYPLEYDQFVLKTNHLYLLNNQLSAKIEDLRWGKKLSFDEMDSILLDLEKIESLQAQYELPNYFPFYKVIEVGIEFLKNPEVTKNGDIERIEKLAKALEGKGRVLSEAFNLMSARATHTFRLPVAECIFEANGSIYIYSGFYLPIDFQTAKERQIEPIKLELSGLLNFVEAAKFFHEKEVVLEAKIRKSEESQKKVEESLINADKRSVEILSIFSAIVLFSIGSFRVFDIDLFIPEHAFLYVLVIGLVLCIFVLLIRWMVVRTDEKVPRFIWLLLWIIGIAIGGTVWMLNGFPPFRNAKYIETRTTTTGIGKTIERTVTAKKDIFEKRLKDSSQIKTLPTSPKTNP